MQFVPLLSLSMFILIGCSQSANKSEKEAQNAESDSIVQSWMLPAELSPEQESALDALNTLQVSTNEKNQLYSTFAGAAKACYPPDTSFTLSQADFLAAMQEFIARNCDALSPAERDTLAAASALAQEEYVVSLCLYNSTLTPDQSGPPMIGTWVMRGILGQRDVVMVW